MDTKIQDKIVTKMKTKNVSIRIKKTSLIMI